MRVDVRLEHVLFDIENVIFRCLGIIFDSVCFAIVWCIIYMHLQTIFR